MKDDVIGLDSSIVTTPSVHQASGHAPWPNFTAKLIERVIDIYAD
jgi:glycyl-tRNA synthetase (class II)